MATTTAQEDITAQGQRRINMIWECTQAVIAISVVGCTMVAGVFQSFAKESRPVPTIMSVAFGTVVGFYFSRTNHDATGGTGAKPLKTPYVGR